LVTGHIQYLGSEEQFVQKIKINYFIEIK